MKKPGFNFYFILINLGILTLGLFLFPTYERLSSGFFLQSLYTALYLSTFIVIEFVVPNKTLKFFTGSFFFIFCLYYLLDAFSLYRSSYHFLDILRIALLGGDIFTTLHEVGISPAVGLSLLTIPLLIWGCGWWLYKKTFTKSLPLMGSVKLSVQVLFVFLLGIFAGEQALNRNSNFYFLRSHRLPLYSQIFEGNWRKFSFSPSPTEKDISEILTASTPVTNPKNILLIILEGVPARALTEETAPTVQAFTKKAQELPNAMTEAIATHLALNSLLFNRPGYSFENDIKAFSDIQSAALPFEIYKKNGYDIFMGISTDFSMKSDEARSLGKKKTVDHYFRGFQGNYVGRNITDNLTAEQAVKWIQQKNPNHPFLMTLQFDCTHWPYEFDEDKIKFKPYLTTDRLDKFDSPDRVQLVINRYKNSLQQLNSNIAKVLSAIETAKLEDDTAIVIISDHGENFSKGLVTHLNLSENSKRITAMIHTPGRSVPNKEGLVTHRDIWPTLLEYTGVEFKTGKKPFTGKSLFSPEEPRSHLFTVNGNLKFAELSYPDKVIHFNAQVDGHSLFLSPFLITDKEGVPLPHWQDHLTQINWTEDVEKSLY